MDLSLDLTPVPAFCGTPIPDIKPAFLATLFGEPDEVELAENAMYGEPINVLHYEALKLSFYFNVNTLVTLSVANKDFKLFNQKVFSMREEEIIELFKANGFPDHEIDKDWGEKQLIFESAGVTVFFDNQFVAEIFVDL